MKKLVTAFLVLGLIALGATSASAEEKLGDLLKRAQELETQGKYPQAMTELSWAMEQLKKKHTEKLKSFMPGEVEGLKPGKIDANNALGLVNLERTYTTADGARIKVALTGGSGSKNANAGLGGLAGFAQMAAAMGGGPNAETVRVQGRRATIMNKRGKIEMTMGLNQGMLLNIQQTSKKGSVTKDTLVALAEAVDYKGLDSYLAEN